jgi:hypothetical protein
MSETRVSDAVQRPVANSRSAPFREQKWNARKITKSIRLRPIRSDKASLSSRALFRKNHELEWRKILRFAGPRAADHGLSFVKTRRSIQILVAPEDLPILNWLKINQS